MKSWPPHISFPQVFHFYYSWMTTVSSFTTCSQRFGWTTIREPHDKQSSLKDNEFLLIKYGFISALLLEFLHPFKVFEMPSNITGSFADSLPTSVLVNVIYSSTPSSIILSSLPSYVLGGGSLDSLTTWPWKSLFLWKISFWYVPKYTAIFVFFQLPSQKLHVC